MWYDAAMQLGGALAERFHLASLRWVLLAIAVMPILFTLQRLIQLIHGTVRFATRLAESAAVAGMLLAAVAVVVRLLEERQLVGAVPAILHDTLVDAWTVVAATGIVASMRFLRAHLGGIGNGGGGNGGGGGSGNKPGRNQYDLDDVD